MKLKTLLKEEVAQAERIGLGDLIIVAFLAVFVFAVSWAWEFPWLLPQAWNDSIVAASLRPAATILSSAITWSSSILFSIFGIQVGVGVLRLLGHLSIAVFAVLCYAVFREWLTLAMRRRPQHSPRRTLVMRLASFVGACVFVFSEPVWMAGQCFSQTTILLGLTLATLEFFFVFLRKGTLKYAYLSSLTLGLLSSTTPLGLLIGLLLICVTVFVYKVMPTLSSPLLRPAVFEVSKWHMTFIFLFSFVFGILFNAVVYVKHGGLDVTAGSIGDVPMAYLLEYSHRLLSAADLPGWILLIGVCIVPFVISLIRFADSADEERFLPYSYGIVYFICGLLALSQSSLIPSLWFFEHFPIASDYLLSSALFCLAATAAFSVTILGVDALCRNHAHLESLTFGDGDEDEQDPDAKSKSARPLPRILNAVRHVGLVLIPVLAILFMLPGRVKTASRDMLALIRDFVREVVREAEGATMLFSDGNLDAAIEFESARQGHPILCYSLMGGEGLRGQFLRTRNLPDGEDLFSFKIDTAMGLRSWIRDKPERLTDTAALMGFDLWKRDGKALPAMSGVLSRPTGFSSEEARIEGIAVAHELVGRVFDILKASTGIAKCTDEDIRRLFYVVQWRLARMCVYRSEVDDSKGDAESAIREQAMAKQLNESNEVYKNLIADMERRQRFMMQALTPREGLQLALVRADFTLGKVYAETILSADADEPNANFALGMYYLRLHQLSLAERYLLRCLIRKPNEPAIYNNLAMLQLELKKFDAALSNVEKALKIIPDSAEVIDTRRRILEAIELEKTAPKAK